LTNPDTETLQSDSERKKGERLKFEI
jgi:hypothetical protein